MRTKFSLMEGKREGRKRERRTVGERVKRGRGRERERQKKREEAGQGGEKREREIHIVDLRFRWYGFPRCLHH